MSGARLRERAQAFRDGTFEWYGYDNLPTTRNWACLAVDADDSLTQEEMGAVADVLGLCRSDSHYTNSMTVFEWNDAPGRTIEEVIDALERAADLMDASV